MAMQLSRVERAYLIAEIVLTLIEDEPDAQPPQSLIDRVTKNNED